MTSDKKNITNGNATFKTARLGVTLVVCYEALLAKALQHFYCSYISKGVGLFFTTYLMFIFHLHLYLYVTYFSAKIKHSLSY